MPFLSQTDWLHPSWFPDPAVFTHTKLDGMKTRTTPSRLTGHMEGWAVRTGSEARSRFGLCGRAGVTRMYCEPGRVPSQLRSIARPASSSSAGLRICRTILSRSPGYDRSQHTRPHLTLSRRTLINVRRLLSRAWPVPCSVAGPCIAVMGVVPGSA